MGAPSGQLLLYPHILYSRNICEVLIYNRQLVVLLTNQILQRINSLLRWNPLTHWGRGTQLSVGKLIIIGSYNGLSPDRRQAIIWTNARFIVNWTLANTFQWKFIQIQQFSLKKMHVKMSSAKWSPSCLGLNVSSVSGESVACQHKVIYRRKTNFQIIQTRSWNPQNTMDIYSVYLVNVQKITKEANGFVCVYFATIRSRYIQYSETCL